MRPRLISRGNVDAIQGIALGGKASMRPRLISRGNEPVVTAVIRYNKLQ